jgi:predicted PurR-regulated permease PerM
MGTAIIWLPAAIWLFHGGSTGWGIFMIIWGLAVNYLEPLVKPLIISHGTDLPFLLIFFGVIGGALTFGFLGVFIGPTLLALGFNLWQAWTTQAVPSQNQKEPLITEIRPAA